MSAMDDMFGHNPMRPDHPDFWRLSEVVLALDGRMEDIDEDDAFKMIETIDSTISEFIDKDSLSYLAMQRTFRALNITSPAQIRQQMRLVALMATVYTEAFVVGATFQKGRMDV